jgi:DNA-binding SARP family transcriptional activator
MHDADEAQGDQPQVQDLELRCFGTPRVLLDGRPLHFPTRHAIQALFRMALSPDGAVSAVELSRSLWPDAPESRLPRRLATLTWQLRRTLADERRRVIRQRDVLLFDREGVRIDLLEARRKAVQEHAEGSISASTAAALASPILVPWSTEPWVVEIAAENHALLARLS